MEDSSVKEGGGKEKRQINYWTTVGRHALLGVSVIELREFKWQLTPMAAK